MDAEAQAAFDRAWRHFQLHAEQRIAVFNFFVASAGLLLTGLAYVLAGPSTLSVLGIAAGAMIAMLACVFWKLDERSAQIIKVSEGEIERLERASTRGPAVFSAVSHLPVSTSAWNVRGVWTFGRSFRLMFLAVALLGVSGMAVSIWRALKSTSAKTVPRPVPKPTSTPTQSATPAPGSSASSRAASVPHPRRSGSPVRVSASSDRQLGRKCNPAPTGHVAPTLVPVPEALGTAEPDTRSGAPS